MHINLFVLIITSFFMVFSTLTSADVLLDVNLASKHIGQSNYCYKGECKSINSSNLGLGLTYPTGSFTDIKVGFYNNSYYKTSVYGGVNFKHEYNIGKLNVVPGVIVGMVTGYNGTPENAGIVAPILLLNVAVGTKNTHVIFGYLPSTMFGGNVNVITVQLQFRL